MAKIAFIAPDKQLFLQARKLAQELGLLPAMTLYLARLRRAVRLAGRLEQEGADVIISRGGTAKLIIEAGLNIPVVELVITGQDLVQLLHQVKKDPAAANRKIFVLGFSNMFPEIERLAAFLDIPLTVLPIAGVEDIALRVDQAAAMGAEIVIGGFQTIRLAAKKGLKTYLISSASFSIRTALAEAQRVALARKVEKERLQQFKILVEAATEGIITVDQDQIIKVFNPMSEKLLAYAAHEVIGKPLHTVFALANVELCLASGKEILGQVVNTGAKWLNANISPITVDDCVIGCLITFQDITRIQQMETNIRNEVSARRFTVRYQFPDIIGVSPAINEAKRVAKEIAAVDATVLITGETGTGKELFAQSIHNHSHRTNGPFVAVNCAALPQNLLESELFGYVEGAFTGAAKKGKAGVFELAHMGTIFLDEVAEMDTFTQIRLLRILQEKQVMRLGDNKYIPVDVRVIAAANKDLKQLVDVGRFRPDLYYRLLVLTLHIPCLQNRSEDIAYLAQHFMQTFNRQYQKQMEFSGDAVDWLKRQSWPGNVRELMNFVERTVVIAKERKIDQQLARQIAGGPNAQPAPASLSAPGYPPEQTKIFAALAQADNNLSQAAKILQIDRSTLYRKLKHYKIEVRKTY
ncbi:MAG: sigma 54-interacting transcriptional regulator [Sporomusaceae bacterium]|nr:sigma 54-interacting transcriptional regulator [Sporomusaceae bacterium]